MKPRHRLGAAAALVALVLAGLLAIPWVLETGALTDRLDASLERATGRAVSLGPISVRPSLRPTFTIAGATIANPPNLSHPGLAAAALVPPELQDAACEVQGAEQDVLRGIGALFGVGRR